MALARTVLAGPRETNSDLPRRLDALGHLMPGGRVPWTFETLAGGVEAVRRDGAPVPTPPPWRLRPGFGVTEGGCVLVGLALALAATPGAEETGRSMIRRRGLDPRQDVVVVPELVRATRGLGDLPLAVVITSGADARALSEELVHTTRWAVTTAGPDGR